jgi:hypothetical protein
MGWQWVVADAAAAAVDATNQAEPMVVDEVMSLLDYLKTAAHCYRAEMLRRPLLLLLRLKRPIPEGPTVALSTVCEDELVGWKTTLALVLQSVSFCKEPNADVS